MTIQEEYFGKLSDGREVSRIWLENEKGVKAAIMNYGATIQSLFIPDRNGEAEDIVLGYDTPQEYEKGNYYFGASVGRVANRIKGSRFTLEGKEYLLTENEAGNTLHGGSGFHKKLWEYKMEKDGLVLSYLSPHLEDGFPGELKTEIRVSLSEENILLLDFRAESDRTTVCSLTGHSYFNLAGVMHREEIRDVSLHQLQIAAENFTPGGELCPAEGTVYNFLNARPVGREELDSNLILTHGNRNWDARMFDPFTGRFLSIRTSLPGMQLYNGSGISEEKGKYGKVYNYQCGLCLEPQFYPDAVHHPEFPQPILRRGEVYHHTIEYHFGVV